MAITAPQPLSPSTLLTLGRVSNRPTVWTNVLAGTVLAGGTWQDGRIGIALVAMSLAYVGGICISTTISIARSMRASVRAGRFPRARSRPPR